MLSSLLPNVVNKPLLGFATLSLLCSLIATADPLNNFKKVGEAKLEILFWDVYQSTLYTSTGSYQKNHFPQALKIHYLRNIKAKDLLERTADEWRKLGISQEVSAPWLNQLALIWPDIKKGDELLLVVNEQGNSDFYFNHQVIGLVPDREFSINFLRIWLDEKSSYPALQKKLIGEQP